MNASRSCAFCSAFSSAFIYTDFTREQENGSMLKDLAPCRCWCWLRKGRVLYRQVLWAVYSLQYHYSSGIRALLKSLFLGSPEESETRSSPSFSPHNPVCSFLYIHLILCDPSATPCKMKTSVATVVVFLCGAINALPSSDFGKRADPEPVPVSVDNLPETTWKCGKLH